jgi:hypothetical protein
MAFKSGKDAFILLDGVAGSPVNVSNYADSFSFPQGIDTIETSVFGTVAKQFIPGLTDGGQIDMSGPLDVALGTFIATLKAAQAAGSSTSTMTWGPAGSISGQLKQSAEVYVSAYSINAGVGGRVEYSASLQVTGAVTTTTW